MSIHSHRSSVSERDQHYRRALALANRASSHLNLPARIRGIFAHPDSNRAERILTAALAHQQAEREFELAADLLGAALEFDDAAEAAAIDGAPLTESIADYLDAAANFHLPGVIAALRAATQPFQTCEHRDLPVLPAAIVQLARTDEDEADTIVLTRIAESDQTLAAHMISAANSPCYGSGYDISCLRQAVLRLGIPLARRVLLQACVGTLFASATLGRLWRHVQQVAGYAAEVAASAGFDAEIAYLAGLLHDIGLLHQSRDSPESQIVLDGWLRDGFPQTYAETLTYGFDHAFRGARLLEEMGLPDEITRAIAIHHQPEMAADSRLATLLFLAELRAADEAGTADPEQLNTGLRMRIAIDRAGPALAGFSEAAQLQERARMAAGM